MGSNRAHAMNLRSAHISRRAYLLHAREGVAARPARGSAGPAAWNHSWNRAMGVVKVQRESEARNPRG
jgi:hypothetical protein